MNGFLMHREIVCKGLGSCLILIASIGCGIGYNRRLHLRLGQHRQLLQLMMLLQGEIEYQCNILPEAFLICGRQLQGICGEWFLETGNRLNAMEGLAFHEIWQQQIQELKLKTVLGIGTIQGLERLGGQLSYPDKDTQLSAIQWYCQRLKQEEEQLLSELPGKLKLGAMLGVLSGMFLVLLLV